MRILHIVTSMNRGGLETMIMNYYRNIDRNKVQFDFLVHRDFEADYDKEILKLGGRIYHISRLIPWSRKYKKELEIFFMQHKEYEIVHVHQDCLSSIALKCAEKQGIQIRIAHSHTANAVKDLKYPIKEYYKKKIPKYATHLLACGSKAGEWMFPGKKYTIVKNAIDLENYRYSKDISFEVKKKFRLEKSLVVGHVGNFTRAKNHDFLIEIFKEIYEATPNAKLLLVGGGNGMDMIKEKVISMGLEKQVVFSGVRDDVNKMMQAMDVFVFPSLYEGLPVTLIEAQAAGIPCVISDRISKECIVTNGLVSVMKLDESPKKWAEVIINKSEITKKSHNDEIAACGYDIKNEAEKLVEFYFNQMEE